MQKARGKELVRHADFDDGKLRFDLVNRLGQLLVLLGEAIQPSLDLLKLWLGQDHFVLLWLLGRRPSLKPFLILRRDHSE